MLAQCLRCVGPECHSTGCLPRRAREGVRRAARRATCLEGSQGWPPGPAYWALVATIRLSPPPEDSRSVAEPVSQLPPGGAWAGADVRAWLARAGLRRLCTWVTQVTQRGEGCPCARLNGGPHPRAPFSPSLALWGLVVAQQEMDRRVQGPERELGSARPD